MMSTSTPKNMVRALVMMLCVLFASFAMAQSQASTGQIAGTVHDSAGAVIPNATVQVSSAELGIDRTVTSNAEGLFRATLLPAGTYTVIAKAANFSEQKVNKVVVEVGRTVDLNLGLAVGKVESVVEVNAEAVQTSSSQPDSLINQTAIDNLPINGRRFQDFATLTPTAQVEPSRQQISLAGQRGIYGANVNIDGADYNQPFFGGIRGGESSNKAYTIPQESIREFQVVDAGYSAEFGRSTGGVLTAVTKSGTNGLHGSGFFLDRNQGLTASNEFYDTFSQQNFNVPVTPAPTQKQWGGSVGGPIKKDKLFFFGAYEQQMVNNPRRVAYTALNSYVPASPTVAAQQATAIAYYHSLEGPFQATNNAIAGLVRLDYNFNERNRLNIRYNHSQAKGQNATSTGGDLFPLTNRSVSNYGTERDRTHTINGQYDSFYGANLSNELRTQWTKEGRPRLANALLPNIATSIGNYGTRNFLPTVESDWRYQLADNLTWQHGKNTWKTGAEFNRLNASQIFAFNQFGAYSVSGGVANSLTDLGGNAGNQYFNDTKAKYVLQVGNGQANLDANMMGAFLQDSYKLRQNLTINAGMRWDGVWYNQPSTTNTKLVNQLGKDKTVWGFLNPSQIPNSPMQFAPRLGFAWDPMNNGKTVVRGFSGIYFAQTPLLIFSDPLANFRAVPNNVSLSFPFTGALPAAAGKTIWSQLEYARTTCGVANPLAGLANPGQVPTISNATLQAAAACMGLTPNPFLNASVTGVSQTFANPRSYQYGLGVEHQFTSSLTAGVDAQMIKTVHLQRNRELNINAGVPTGASLRPVFSKIDNTLNQVQIRESTAKSLYRALVFRAAYKKSWMQLNAFYTLSKNISDDDNERDSGGISYDSVTNLAAEYNYSNLDRTHQFVANPVFFLPWGFELSSAMRLRSGRPFNAEVGSDVNNDQSSFTDRPYVLPGVVMKRNNFRNQAIKTVDMRVQKTFNVKEKAKVIVLADMFNVFNAMNLELDNSSSAVTNYCTTFTVDCGMTGSSLNPTFLKLRNPATGQLLTGSENPGQPLQAQFGVRVQF